MKGLLLAIGLALSAAPIGATAYGQTAQTTGAPSAREKAREATDNSLIENRSYRNTAGAIIHSPTHTKSGKAPAGASAQCRDSTFSFSQSRRGTCSHHGGVAAWL